MEDKFTLILDAFYELSGSSNQRELADWLGIPQSSITDARRRKTISMHWLLTTSCKSKKSIGEIVEALDITKFKTLVF